MAPDRNIKYTDNSPAYQFDQANGYRQNIFNCFVVTTMQWYNFSGSFQINLFLKMTCQIQLNYNRFHFSEENSGVTFTWNSHEKTIPVGNRYLYLLVVTDK